VFIQRHYRRDLLPLGVTACSETIYEAFLSDDKSKTFFHGHSYTANPLACAAALASLDVMESMATQQQLAELTAQQRDFAMALKRHPRAGNVRQLGTIVACDALVNEATSYFHSVRDQIVFIRLIAGGVAASTWKCALFNATILHHTRRINILPNGFERCPQHHS
jgi:adenosylmethionine-8-amino-7-oxononanoate aminotransferase